MKIVVEDPDTGLWEEIETSGEPTHETVSRANADGKRETVNIKMRPAEIKARKAEIAKFKERHARERAKAEREQAEQQATLARMDRGEATQQEIANLLRKVLPQ